MQSRRSLVYHQNAVLHIIRNLLRYIIKPQENARWRVMRYKVSEPTLMICTALRAAMICQACGLDKKILVPKNENFLAPPVGLEPTTCGLTVRRSTD